MRTAEREGSSLVDELWPAFTGSTQQLRVLRAELASGVPLGTTREGYPAVLALVRPAPVRIAVVGQAWVASLLAIRAAVLGTTTVIVTDRPAPWHVLVRGVGGSHPFATVVDPAATGSLPPPSVAAPVFMLHDGSAGGAEAVLARAPWQTSVHLVFRLGTSPSAVLDAADPVLVTPPQPDEVEQVLAALRLPDGLAGELAGMAPAEVLAVTRSGAAFVTVQATAGETAVLRAT